MGRSSTPKYRIEFAGGSHFVTAAAWPGEYLGKPSKTKLAQYMAKHEESLREGGANAHLNTVGYVPPTSARVIRQSDDALIAEFKKEGGRG